MHDLEAYCRVDATVFTEIKSIIADPSKGIKYLMRDKEIPLAVISKVVTEMAKQGSSNSSGGGKYCQRCGRTSAGRCTGCGNIY